VFVLPCVWTESPALRAGSGFPASSSLTVSLDLLFVLLDFRSPAVLFLFPAHVVKESTSDFLTRVSFFSSSEGTPVQARGRDLDFRSVSGARNEEVACRHWFPRPGFPFLVFQVTRPVVDLLQFLPIPFPLCVKTRWPDLAQARRSDSFGYRSQARVLLVKIYS
jgi:hypothetical protein